MKGLHENMRIMSHYNISLVAKWVTKGKVKKFGWLFYKLAESYV